MNLPTTQQPLTMSTREIADLLGKTHSNIKVSAERLSERGIIGTLALHEFKHNGNSYTEYMLKKRDCLILVAQNCPEFTAAIVDRWQELEQTTAQFATLPDHTNEIIQLESALSIAKRKKELADEYNSLVIGTKALPMKSREQIEDEFLIQHINKTSQSDHYLIEQSMMCKQGSPFYNLKRGEGRKRVRAALDRICITVH